MEEVELVKSGVSEWLGMDRAGVLAISPRVNYVDVAYI
jgi:hypothetical protein